MPRFAELTYPEANAPTARSAPEGLSQTRATTVYRTARRTADTTETTKTPVKTSQSEVREVVDDEGRGGDKEDEAVEDQPGPVAEHLGAGDDPPEDDERDHHAEAVQDAGHVAPPRCGREGVERRSGPCTP